MYLFSFSYLNTSIVIQTPKFLVFLSECFRDGFFANNKYINTSTAVKLSDVMDVMDIMT